MNIKKMNKGLDFLREKYGAAKGEIVLKDGHCWVGATPLIPGRMERKIVELKKMTENGTLEGVSTLRFASFAPKGSDMKAMLYDTVTENGERGDLPRNMELISRERLTYKPTVEKGDIAALYAMTPYSRRTSRESAERLLSLDKLDITFSFDVFVYAKKEQV